MAADLQIVCSVGPPTVSDTGIPTDYFSVNGDYVLFLALPTKNGFTNRKAKPFAIRQFNVCIPPLSTRLRVFFRTAHRSALGIQHAFVRCSRHKIPMETCSCW
jgi:hypothetical protein